MGTILLLTLSSETGLPVKKDDSIKIDTERNFSSSTAEPYFTDMKTALIIKPYAANAEIYCVCQKAPRVKIFLTC